DIIDRHLTAGRAQGIATPAVVYLVAVAAVQALTFLSGYLAAAIAQRVLADVRTQLFAHVQRLPSSYFDRVSIGDVISRCTADVDALDTVFSSSVAVLLASLVRLGTIALAMVALSPTLSVLAALIAVPLVLLTRFVQVRVRQAERESRLAVGAVNTRLHEDLKGIEVIRAFGREPEFVAGFRQVLSRGLAAFNQSTFYSALYMPVTAIMSAVAIATLLAADAQPAFGALHISLGTLTAFLLLLQRFFQPITALGEEGQTVQAGTPSSVPGSAVLTTPSVRRGTPGRLGARCRPSWSTASRSDTWKACRLCVVSPCGQRLASMLRSWGGQVPARAARCICWPACT